MTIDFNEVQYWLPKYQMLRLKELSLISVQSDDLLYQFPYGMPNLEKLQLTFSSSSERLVADIPPQKRLGVLLQLRELVLWYPNIKDLGLGRAPFLQRLELLSLVGCRELDNLGPPSVSLTYLTYLELNYCQRLRNLMTSSTAKSMV